MTAETVWAIRLVWVGVTGLAAVLWRTEALVLLVGLVFLGPFLREAGISRDLDEREQMLHMQAGYYGFLSAMLVVFAVMVTQLVIRGNELDPSWYLVLAVPLLVQGSFYVRQESGWRKLGLGLGFTIGGFWTVFTLLAHGLTVSGLIESAVGLSILVPTFLALKWPRAGGVILLFLGIGAGLFFTRGWVRSPNPFTVVLMYCLIPLPLVMAGIALMRSGTGKVHEGEDVAEEV